MRACVQSAASVERAPSRCWLHGRYALTSCAQALLVCAARLDARQRMNPVGLEAGHGLPAAGSAGTGERLTALWSPKPPTKAPKEFVDAADRVRIERAIRLAAVQLEKERAAQARYAKEHDAAVKREDADESEAKMLHARAVSLAQKAIDQRTTYHVELDRANRARQETELDKRIATLMAGRSRGLKRDAKVNTQVAQQAAEEAAHLKHTIRTLEQEAREKGSDATAIVDSATKLLNSARTLSDKAAAEESLKRDQSKLEHGTLLSRMHDHKRLEQEAMQHVS